MKNLVNKLVNWKNAKILASVIGVKAFTLIPVYANVICEMNSKTKVEICSYDYDNDGKIDEITTCKYDSKERRLKVNNDYDADGKADRITTYSYGVDGNISRRIDCGADGLVDEFATYY